MSQSKSPTAKDVYERHTEEVEELAERDDEIGAIMRAVKRVGGDDDAE